jgi:hypothetical protein
MREPTIWFPESDSQREPHRAPQDSAPSYRKPADSISSGPDNAAAPKGTLRGSREADSVDGRQRVGHAGPVVALVLAYPEAAGGGPPLRRVRDRSS